MDGAIKTPPRPIWQAQHERRLNVAEAILMALGRPLHKQRGPMVLQQGLISPWRIALESVRSSTVEASMIKFDDYREEYSHIRERQGGILQITFHTGGRQGESWLARPDKS
jgi:hypothetical protein